MSRFTLRSFLKLEASAGVLLVAAAILALIVANSPAERAYHALLALPFVVSVGEYSLGKPLFLWINDGLMAIFFFVVGLEIKRETLVGELASVRKSALPIAGALGKADGFVKRNLAMARGQDHGTVIALRPDILSDDLGNTLQSSCVEPHLMRIHLASPPPAVSPRRPRDPMPLWHVRRAGF